MGYDEQYAGNEAVFGRDAEETLGLYLDRVPVGAPVLDIGAGQGRNAFFLLDHGFTVHALEPSTVAAAKLREVARQRGPNFEVFESDFHRFDTPPRSYAGLLAFGLIPDLYWRGIRELVDRLDRWAAPGALLWVSGFTTQDPAYDRYASEDSGWEEIARHSFRDENGRVRTYLEPGQILQLLAHHTVIHHWEGLGPEHRHGDGAPERHGMFQAVFQTDPGPA